MGVLGVSRYQQRRNHISSEQLAAEFGMCNGIDELLVQRHLRWLGHVARMGTTICLSSCYLENFNC